VVPALHVALRQHPARALAYVFNGDQAFLDARLCRVADSYVATGRTGGATRVLAEARELMDQQGEVYWEPELFRLLFGEIEETPVPSKLGKPRTSARLSLDPEG
jgi:hypothetical protein